MSIHDVISLLLYIYVAIRQYFALNWLKLSINLNIIPRLFKPRSDFYHKLVVIGTTCVVFLGCNVTCSNPTTGDGFGQGFGDYVTLASGGGIAYYLRDLIKEEPKIRHKWGVVNRGILGSFSEDWLPGPSTGYFKDTFSQETCKDAELVLILLGAMDASKKPNPIDDETTVKNLIQICDALRKKGIRVCLATLPPAGRDIDGDKQRKRNKLIEQFCESTTYDEIPVLCGPSLHAPKYRKTDTLCFDGVHLNSKAYKMLAKDTIEFITPLVTNLEWNIWKEKTENIVYDQSLYE